MTIKNDFARVRLGLSPNDANGLAALARIEKLHADLLEDLEFLMPIAKAAVRYCRQAQDRYRYLDSDEDEHAKVRQEGVPQMRTLFAGEARSAEEIE